MKPWRKYYVPGLISLLGLPILILIFGPREMPEQNAISLFLPTDDISNTEVFSKASINNAIKNKKVDIVYLGEYEDRYNNYPYLVDHKLNYIQREVEGLQFKNDTNNVLKIQFVKGATFGHFITVLNMARNFQFRRYALHNNEFYFFANDPPDLSIIEPENKKFESRELIEENENDSWPSSWQILKWKLSYHGEVIWWEIKQNLLLCFGFLLLIFIPFLAHFKIRRMEG